MHERVWDIAERVGATMGIITYMTTLTTDETTPTRSNVLQQVEMR